MKSRLVIVAVVASFAAFFMTIPAHLHGQQPDAQQHEQHHPPATTEQATQQANMMSMMARMKANDARLEDLVQKMNAATGAAKTDAMAQLVTALVEDRRNA